MLLVFLSDNFKINDHKLISNRVTGFNVPKLIFIIS